MNLDTIFDQNMREFIEKEKLKIMKKRSQPNQFDEQGEGSQYHGSQYWGSNYQWDQTQAQEDQTQGDQPQGDQNQDFTQYYNYLEGSGNKFPSY